jgi:predicted metalloprotease
MKWDRDHRSDYVEDRRGQGVGGGGSGGLVWMLFWVFRRFGIVGVIVVIAGYAALRFFGGGGSGVSGQGQAAQGQGSDEQYAFVSFVLDDVQGFWKRTYDESGKNYPMATLVVFTGRTDTACGLGSSATGPFYCPRDQQVYIDLGFFQTLQNNLGANGDFARAYVIAHEMGHHISNIEDVLDKGRDKGADSGSVRVELQADCYAGVWAHDANRRKLLEMGDIEEAMNAAKAIGDDTLQEKGTGTVRPETFTHGTSAQRMKWFDVGFKAGDPNACNTFAAQSL